MTHHKEVADPVELFKHVDGKVENLRADVAEAIKHDMALSLKMDQLTDRVNNGVAITGQKTLEKVTELVKLVGEYRVEMTTQAKQLTDQQKVIDRIVTLVFTIAGTGVLGGIIAMIWKIIF